MVRFAHEQRFHAARQLVAAAAPLSLLDYGCGDGHFLIELIAADVLSPSVKLYAFEPTAEVTQLLEANLQRYHYQGRVDVITDHTRLVDLRFDYIACMGVLEHLPLLPRFVFYDFLAGALTPAGLGLIDVPIEIGPSVLIKEFGRRVLKSDPPDYALPELIRIAVGGTVFDPKRFDPNESDFIVRHRGFDHRILSGELEQRFTIVQRTSTPLPYFPPWLGNQELLLTVRPTATPTMEGCA